MNIVDMPTSFPGRPRKTKLALIDMLLYCFDAQVKANQPHIQVLQVGAHDGKMDDPITPYLNKGHWSGVLIEPHPFYFRKLTALHHENSRHHLLNIAVSDEPGIVTLYHLDEAYHNVAPGWLLGCASLTRDRMEKAIARANHRQRLSLPQDALTSTDVKAKRLDAILAEVGVTEIDLLLIDVEGHEIPVMKSFDLISARPKIAIIECNAGDREAEATIVNMLKAAGLICYKLANDIVAFREGSLLLPLEAVFHFEHVPTLTGEME